MALSLEGKVAIVTGASRSRGIGAQVAYELAKRGAKVSEEYLVTQWALLFHPRKVFQPTHCIGLCNFYLPQ